MPALPVIVRGFRQRTQRPPLENAQTLLQLHLQVFLPQRKVP